MRAVTGARCSTPAFHRTLPAFGLGALLGAAAALAGACGPPPGGGGLPQTSMPRAAGNQVVLEDVEIDRFEQDQLRTRARVARLHLDRTIGLALGDGVRIDVLEKEPRLAAAGVVHAQVEAPHGRSILDSRVVTLEDGVTLRDREGRVLRTASMTYDSGRDFLSAPGVVTVEGENFRATGASLSGHPVKGDLEVGAPVWGHVEPRPHQAEPRKAGPGPSRR